jgi:iron complex outermembrane recepter protein
VPAAVAAVLSATLSCATLAAAPGTPAGAAADDVLDQITLSATRLRGVANFDVPASVDTITLNTQNNRGDINFSEALLGVPGIAALDRQNYAQDTQLSIRGFGARSTFGVRGVRLFADGIPASMPDGQGQVSNFNLLGGERVEIMRGPFSALYGNSSGGVVQLWSKDGEAGDPSRAKASVGSYDAYTLGAQTMGRVGIVGYNVAVQRFDTDGYRDHSAARRNSANARLSFNFSDERRLNLVLNYVELPEAQDPLGVTRAQWEADPDSVAAVALQFNTRKTVEQLQGGLVYEQALGTSQTLRLMGYFGNRQVMQVLAIPPAAQLNPLNAGGVIDLDNDFGGADLRWSWQGELAGRRVEFTAGTNYDSQDQFRQGFENFVGSTVGIRGALRRNETNRVSNFDQFAQGFIQLAPRWSLLAGVRHSEVTFRSNDRYITARNPDDSGRIEYSDTTPVAGLMFRATEDLRLYASAGNGFETPTFNELSYRADGGAGLALNLRPATSDNVELGAKWRNAGGYTLDVALFRADTADELAVARNVGGRSSFRNVGAARREGFEVAAELPFTDALRLQLAYTRLNAEFRSGYLICASAGCTVPNVPVPAGSRIPGVSRDQLYSRLQWQAGGWTAAAEAMGMGRIVVNDAATEAAPGYLLGNVELARGFKLSSGLLRGFVRVDNVLDKGYIGSVIVNEGNGRFFEGGPGRTFMVGGQFQWGP